MKNIASSDAMSCKIFKANITLVQVLPMLYMCVCVNVSGEFVFHKSLGYN